MFQLTQIAIIRIIFIIDMNLPKAWAAIPFSDLSPSGLTYTSYQTAPYCTPSQNILYPSSILEVQTIIFNALATGKTVKALGSRHSVTDIICTDGIPISMCKFKSAVLHSDGTATFGAGTTLQNALEYLNSRNRSLIQIPGYGGITIGGAIGTGAHGSTLKHQSSLSDQVVRMTIVDGAGRIRIINSRNQDLKTFRIHLGLLGVVINVTFKTVPLYKMKAIRTLESESILLDGTAIQLAEAHDYIQFAWFPSKEKTVVVKGNFTEDSSLPGNSVTTLFSNISDAASLYLRNNYDAIQENRNTPAFIALEDYAILSLYQRVKDRVPIYTENGKTFTNPAVGIGWKLMSSQCTQCQWLHGNQSLFYDEASLACDISELPAIVGTIKGILKQLPVGFPFAGIVFRFHKESDATISFANGRKSVVIDIIEPNRIEFNNKAKMGLGGQQAIFQAVFEKHGGRPHWGKNGLYFFSKDVIPKVTPHRSTFIKAMMKYDPLAIFRNKFAKRFLGHSNQMDLDPKEIHCALRNDCICQSDANCADGQTCTSILDIDNIQSYAVCKDLRIIENPPVGPYDPYNVSSIFQAIFQ